MATQITTGYRFHKLERETIVLNQPTLNPPTVSTKGEFLSVIDGNNGTFTTGYKVFANGGYLITSEKGTIDLSNVEFPEGQLDVPMTASCIGDLFNESIQSGVVMLKLKGYLKIKEETGTTAKLYTTFNEVKYNAVTKPNAYTAYLN